MFFVLQNPDENPTMKLETEIIKSIIEETPQHSFEILSLKNISSISDIDSARTKKLTGAIPIGSLGFVQTFLKTFRHIDYIKPIEIPPCLQTLEFLKRDYKIVSFDEIPEQGIFFIKDVSELKSFVHIGNKNTICIDEINKEHRFQVSEYITHIYSEYRLYFINGKLENCGNYNGNPIQPIDVNLIQKANLIYQMQFDYPKSYTMDIMVTERGTSIIEIHPFVSVGLYNTLWGDNLLSAYADGIDYIVKTNKQERMQRNDFCNRRYPRKPKKD